MPPDDRNDDAPDDAPEDLPGELPGFNPPLPPDDRLWRHPSEMTASPAGATQPGPPAAPGFGPGDGSTRSARRRGRGIADLRLWLVAGTSAFAGAVLTLLILSLGGTFDTSEDSSPPAGEVNITVPANPGDSEIAMTQALAPSVVNVAATGPVSATSGTALVLSDDGHLVTTADTVDGAQEIVVTFADGSASPATVVGVDAREDVAVLKVDRTDLTPFPTGDTGVLQLGARATVLSTAESAAGSSTVAVGLISGLGEQVHLSADTTMHGLIQANIRLSSVESGAPLVDSTGAVVGLVTKRGQTGGEDVTPNATTADTGASQVTLPTSEQGVTIRFAVSIDWVQAVADDLIRQGHVDHVWLGIRGGELSDSQITRTGHDGALVTEVTQESPAATAGITAGDVIIAVDGSEVDSMSDLIVGIRDHEPGDAVTVDLLREGTESATAVTLAPRADGAD